MAYVELFNDENGKPRGCGVVEFTNSEAMKKALFVMHRYELNGRKLVLKEETGLYLIVILPVYYTIFVLKHLKYNMFFR